MPTFHSSLGKQDHPSLHGPPLEEYDTAICKHNKKARKETKIMPQNLLNFC